MMSRTFRAGSLVAVLWLGTAYPQSAEAPACRTPELQQAGFPVSHWAWSVREPDTGRVKEGRASWTLEVRGCVLAGRLQSEDFEEFRLLAYDSRSRQWDLVAADSHHGNLVRMSGGAAGDGLEFFSTSSRSGRLLLDRITIRPAGDGTVRWTLETSRETGASWIRLVEEEFRPATPPAER